MPSSRVIGTVSALGLGSDRSGTRPSARRDCGAPLPSARGGAGSFLLMILRLSVVGRTRSLLRRSTSGFECVVIAGVPLEVLDHAVPHGPDMPERRLDGSSAASTRSLCMELQDDPVADLLEPADVDDLVVEEIDEPFERLAK